MSSSAENTSAKSHLLWAKSKLEGEEHVTLPNFVARFKYSDKEVTYLAYSNLVNATELSRKRRERLQEEFDSFKAHQEEEFWSNLKTNINSENAIRWQAELEFDQHIFNLENQTESNPRRDSSEPQLNEDHRERKDREGRFEISKELLPAPSATPFQELVQYVYERVQGVPTNVPHTPQSLSRNHKEIYEYVRDILMNDNARDLTGESTPRDFILDSVVFGKTYPSVIKEAQPAIDSNIEATSGYLDDRSANFSLRAYANFNWDTVISVFEFKPSSEVSKMCDNKQRRAVRHNTAILLDLEKRGLDTSSYFPVIAEGLGLALNFYTLRRYDDVIGTGRTTSKCAWLPYDETSLKEWLLSDSVHILLAFTKHTLKFASAAIQSMARMMAGPLPTTPPPAHRPFPSVAFTPPKSHKRSRSDDDDHAEYH
ncbi:hypothetical protein BGX26_001711 [Mortierella sp. AD094]|nr:hypothetical protein BGX26_001711 [Mortierella sp. AD094]